MKSSTVLHAVTLAGLMVAGCSKGDATEQAAPGASQGNEAAPEMSGESTSKPSDAQILGILATVDKGEIQQAQVALSRASDPRVKQYANHMIEQHTSSTQKASDFAAKNNLTPASSQMASKLDTKGKEVVSALTQATPAAFDTTYMKDQMEQHQQVLNMMRDQLAPAASSSLAAELPPIQSMVQSHLEMAREILPTLTASGQQPAMGAAHHPNVDEQ